MIALQRPGNAPDSIKSVTVKINGAALTLTLDINLPTQRYIWEQLAAGMLYEPLSTIALFKELRPGDVFFDVGANCGWFSAVAATRIGANGVVVGFEPDPVNFAAYRRNAPRAYIFERAVSDFTGEVALYQNLDNDGGHALWRPGLHPHNTATAAAGNPNRKVPCLRLDDFKIAQPNVIKIDTEGAECNVLLGAERILADKRLRMVICERHPMGLELLGHSPEEVEAIMRRHGFRWDEMETQEHVENWIFRR